jgi:hypothetical protein
MNQSPESRLVQFLVFDKRDDSGKKIAGSRNKIIETLQGIDSSICVNKSQIYSCMRFTAPQSVYESVFNVTLETDDKGYFQLKGDAKETIPESLAPFVDSVDLDRLDQERVAAPNAYLVWGESGPQQ